MLKTYMQVELNEFFMDKIDNSEYFDGLDEMEKSQFIGNFFMWIKNQFVKTDVKKPVMKKEVKNAEETLDDKKHDVKKAEKKLDKQKEEVKKTEKKLDVKKAQVK